LPRSAGFWPITTGCGWASQHGLVFEAAEAGHPKRRVAAPPSPSALPPGEPEFAQRSETKALVRDLEIRPCHFGEEAGEDADADAGEGGLASAVRALGEQELGLTGKIGQPLRQTGAV
jgi:hypothetical protein